MTWLERHNLSHGTLIAGLWVFAGYYLGAKIGFALTFEPRPVSVLWPPNAILTATLLLTRPQSWWIILLAALPAHWAAQLESQVPPLMILSWFISNCCEALIGAGLARYLIDGPVRLTNLRNVAIFSLCVVFTGPFLSSFLDAALVRWNDWGSGSYWELWRIRLTSNFLASLTVTSLIVTWATTGFAALKSAPRQRLAEAILLLLGLGFASFAVFHEKGSGTGSTLLYLPLPFLLWAAVRFGTCGAATASSIIAFSAISSAAYGHGPFSSGPPEDNALAIQLFLVVMALPLMFLAALIEERSKTEQDLRDSEERYREVVESQTELVCRYLPDTTLTFVNEAYCRFFKRRREELIGKKFLDLVPPESRDEIAARIAGLTKDRRTLTHEHKVAMPDGGSGWQQWIDYAIVDADGHVREYQGIGRDISERVRAEAALSEREARISLAAESANVALWVYEPERDTTWMSEKGRVIYGFEPSDVLSRAHLADSVHPDDREAVEAAFDHTEDCAKPFEIEHRIVKPDGETNWVITRGRHLCDEHGKTIELIGVTIDITAQKKAALQLQANREEIAHFGRLAAMGEIAVSLAHELTQPLTGMVSNADAGRRIIDHRKVDIRELRDLLADISADGLRAGNVIHGIRRMVKRGTAARKHINLNDLVRELVQLVGPEALLRSCEVRAVLEPDLPLVVGDPVELQQVLLNLVVNAFDAMRGMPSRKRKAVIITRWNASGFVEVNVLDHGAGIPEEVREHLFEKFFTTKAEGLGMGLAIARTIAEAHGGTITVESTEGGGAQFSLTLPAGPPAAWKEAPTQAVPPQDGEVDLLRS